MPQTKYSYDDLLAIQDIVRETARHSLAVYFARSTADYKHDGSIVTEADLAMQQSLTKALAERFPNVQMLGEEISEAEQTRVIQGDTDYWCLDPVDGTTNFHATVPLFSVSLGLISEGEVVLGLVYDPNRDECFGAIRQQGFWIDGETVTRPRQPDHLASCIAFIDFKRLSNPMSTSLVQDTPYKSQRNIGTCALEWAWLAAGRVNLLLHGRERIWDYAAGVLLIEEAGGKCETFDGEAVFRQTLIPRSVVAASNPELFELWAARIRSTL
ncbi:MAG: inositol monophosphatase family protein [Gammaproteobacteria bacterium]|nr:MAG: inositol monophosphatase family protein [Gammaproteobacteria bacterium]